MQRISLKVRVLIFLFSLRGIFHFIDGITEVREGSSFQDYSNDFIYTGTMAFIIYLIYAERNNLSYWFIIFMSALIVVRFVGMMAINLYYGHDPSLLPQAIVVLGAIYTIVFGIIPLLLLSTKELRDSFLHPKVL